jgi:hypothetical protein
MLTLPHYRLKRWHLIAFALGFAFLVAGGLAQFSQHDGKAEAQSPPDPSEIYAFFRSAPKADEAPSFRGINASGAIIRPAIDRPGHQVFGVATPDGQFCLVVQQGWASRGCLPTKELADGTRLMWSLDYTGGDQVQLTTLIPDAASAVSVQWRSGDRVPVVPANNVVQVTAKSADLPVTVSWTDSGGTPRQETVSG